MTTELAALVAQHRAARLLLLERPQDPEALAVAVALAEAISELAKAPAAPAEGVTG